jgi:integrase
LKAREIHISGQIVYQDDGEGYKFYESTTKTDAGVRCIPMTQMVYEAFLHQKELNFMLGNHSEVEIGERSGFIFNTKHGRPIMPAGVNSFLSNIVNAYNKKETVLAEKEKREPELMPHISAHTLRHTGCTRMGESNVNPKVMQYVMGHSDIDVTMNVYNHISDKGRVEAEMSKMDIAAVV